MYNQMVSRNKCSAHTILIESLNNIIENFGKFSGLKTVKTIDLSGFLKEGCL